MTEKRPNTLISDGAPNFYIANNKEFFTTKNPRTRYFRHIRLNGDHNNNKIERLNGETRDRKKTIRGLKRMDTLILREYQIYHNYIREHKALKGQTSAEECGFKEGKNEWKTLIENASCENKL